MSETSNRYEDACATAEGKACDVVHSHDRVLMLDIDSDPAHDRFLELLELCNELKLFPIDPQNVTCWRSSGGNRHYTIALQEPMSDEARVVAQALLGSDLKREMLSLHRVRRGEEHPILLFRPRVALPEPVLPGGF
jgi:hypothetical protein